MTAYGPYIHERTLALPSGYRLGAHESRAGRSYYWVLRNRDGAAALCPLTPAEDELCPTIWEMRDRLHAACDEALREASSDQQEDAS